MDGLLLTLRDTDAAVTSGKGCDKSTSGLDWFENMTSTFYMPAKGGRGVDSYTTLSSPFQHRADFRLLTSTPTLLLSFRFAGLDDRRLAIIDRYYNYPEHFT